MNRTSLTCCAAATVGLFVMPMQAGATALELPADNPRDMFRKDASWFSRPWKLSEERLRTNEVTIFPLEEHNPMRVIDGVAHTAVTRRWWWAAPTAAGAYLVLLSLGQRVMRDRKALDLKKPLAVWNLLLALFSMYGMLVTVPHLLAENLFRGYEYTICRHASARYGQAMVGFAVEVFIYSKFFELIDTAFLVLRKRNVGFLHWYHHCTVLLYCWHAFMNESSTGLYFVAMNYSVHAIMYFYYFLAAVTKPPKWALFVTTIQIQQMVVGLVVNFSHIYFARTLPSCDVCWSNVAAALIMYASYFALFADFMVKRFCLKRKAGAAKKAE